MSTAKPRGESWGSDSFSVVSLSDCRDSGDESDVRISVSADEAESGEWEDVGVHINAPDEVAGVQDPVTVVVMEPHEIVNDYCENPQPREGDNSRGRVRSRSRDAKEALMAFYLGRAKLSETRSKAFVVTPAPPVEIPPLKAPERYSVAVREEVLRIENERRAKSALEQFYRRREDTKLKRAVLNRMNEFKLYQTQCGLTTTGSIIHQQH